MIRIILGNVGSGKTALAVRDMYKNPLRRRTFTNIKTELDHVVPIDASMIVKREIVDHKRNRKTGVLEPVVKLKLNISFWKAIVDAINVTIDEAHTIMNARRAMKKENIIMGDWISLIRRILGETKEGGGKLTLITQLPRRLDPIARDMATQITYCVMHYLKSCSNCGNSWQENSEMPETYALCPRCGSTNIMKYSHTIEVWEFTNMLKFELWKDSAKKTFYKHHFVRDIENYFDLYDTLQWDNLFTDYDY